MPEMDELQRSYAKYRIERAKEDLDVAHRLFENGNERKGGLRAALSGFAKLNN